MTIDCIANADVSSPTQLAAANRVDVLLCANSLYLQHVAVCLTSLLINNPDLFFDILIVGRSTEALDEDKLRRSLMSFSNHDLSFRKFTAPSDLALPLNPRAHYTLDNWTRLWVEQFYPCETQRVLYLDSDIVVVGSIADLWFAKLDGALLGAIDIPGSLHGVTRLGLRPEVGYFNSGVLLIDLEQWRNTQALKTILNYVDAHPEQLQFTLDQDALNACFYARTKRLDYKWNVTWPFFYDGTIPLDEGEVERVKQEARIIHFNGNLKPWSYFCDHPRKAEYEKYLRLTEWKDFIPPDRTLVNRVRKAASGILPDRARRFLKTLIAAGR